MRSNKTMKNLRRYHRFLALLGTLPFLVPCSPGAQKSAGSREYLVYIGTYTRENSKGIYTCRLDAATGKLSALALAAETINPSFLTLHPNGKFLYAANETPNYEGKAGGSLTGYAIEPSTGKLTLLNTVSSRGAGPCYVAVDKSGKSLLAANYGGGSVVAVPVRDDGRLGEASAFVQHTGSSVNPKRQQAPHAHSINLSRDNRFAVAADLGLDQLLVYAFDPVKGSLVPNDPAFAKLNPGAGPRHFAFHPDGRYGYVINELQSTVTALAYEASRGVFKEIQTITTLPENFQGNNSTAEVQVHPTGKFLYGSNRGHDSIAVFAIDSNKGTLTSIEQVSTQGKTPRNFGIDPTGSYLLAANQNSNNIVVFAIDPKTGRLTPTGQVLEVGSPVCVKFLAVK
jgi:6-phosphogluconolactonase